MVSSVASRECARPDLPSEKVGLHCPFCGNGIIGPNIECCGCLLSWLWKDDYAYQEFYRTSNYHDNQYRVNRGKTCQELYGEARNASKERLRFLEPFKTKATNHILDIGAGNGAFRDEADFQGYHAVGIDPNPIGTVVYGEWKDVGGTWDFLTLHDVFEHIINPRETLSHLRGCLGDSGLLVIEMPEFEAPYNWEKHKKPLEHVILYSKSAAEQIFKEEGFDSVLFYRPLKASIGKQVHFLQKAN